MTEEVTVGIRESVVHQIYQALVTATTPMVYFNEDFEVMRREAEKIRLEAIGDARFLIAPYANDES